jgi:biofilm PGA synthesis N-glycosyltransferase PgaC
MIIIPVVFILTIVILSAGFKKFLKNASGYSESTKISIVTAARNESAAIERFISSVEKLDYPKENFELIIVDDNSTDNTYALTEGLTANQKNFIIIKAEEKTIDAKRGALLKGIEASQYPFILITDADCVPLSNWLKAYASVFKKGNDFVFGPAPFFKEGNFINKVSCFENIKNHFLSFSLASIGLPYTASARNLGFSKEAFLRIGGYNNTLDTLSGDDDLLLREAVKNKLKISAFYDDGAMVYSSTKKNMREYLNQKARHTKSSFHYLLRSKIILGIWHLLNLFMFCSLFLIFINFNFIWLFALKIFVDTILIVVIQKKLGYDFNVPEIIFHDLFYEIFTVINFFNAFFRKVKWK